MPAGVGSGKSNKWCEEAWVWETEGRKRMYAGSTEMWAEREGRLHQVFFCKDKDGIEGLVLGERREWSRFSVYLFLCPAQLSVHRKCLLVLEAGILGRAVRKKVGEGLCESLWMDFKEERETAAVFPL